MVMQTQLIKNQRNTNNFKMNTQIVSRADPILLHSIPNHHPFTKHTSTVSYTPKSRNSNGPWRIRAAATARVDAFYTPTEAPVTLYELLEITESGSSFSDIKKAYKQMARKYHPDVSPPDQVNEYTRRFIMVHDAYETLSNPRTRALYDTDLAAGFFSTKSPHYHYQENDERGEWRHRWQSQLDELKRRDSRENMSWVARMRNQR